MTASRRFATALSIILLGVGNGSLRAQVAGSVADPGGRPVADVLVELWSPTARMAVSTSDGAGRFAFSREEAQGATAILLRQIGYRPLRRALAERDTLLTLTLHPIPIGLPPFVVTGSRTVCSASEDREARRWWELVRARYRPFTEGPWWADAYLDRRSVPAADLTSPDTTRLGTGQLGFTRSFLDGWTRSIERDGYARKAAGEWEYPPLHSMLAGHFVDALFGRLQRFPSARETPEGVEIAFCSRDTKQPYVEGIVRLGRDTTISAVTWRFDTNDRHEAGGELLFAPRRIGAAPAPLLPITGTFWEKRAVNYFRERWEFRGWHDCAEEPSGMHCF